jgi:hypothetical protein
MTTDITKAYFIQILSQELGNSENKDQLLAYAKQLIPSEGRQLELKLLTSKRVYRAYNAYTLLNPNEMKPSIDVLIQWLMTEGPVGTLLDLEKRLINIETKVYSFGPIVQKKTYTLTWSDMMDFIFWSHITPALQTKLPRY